jgi:hypothetical protein
MEQFTVAPALLRCNMAQRTGAPVPHYRGRLQVPAVKGRWRVISSHGASDKNTANKARVEQAHYPPVAEIDEETDDERRRISDIFLPGGKPASA